MSDTIGTLLIDVKADTQQLVKGFTKAENAVKKTTADMKRNILSLTATYLSFQGAVNLSKSFLRNADAMTNVNSKLKLVTKSSEELLSVNESLYNMSQLTRTSMLSNVDLYQKMSLATDSLNLSQKELLGLTETISKSMIVSGTDVAGMNALVTQLGQAFASDFKAVAQEMQTITDQSPRLMKAIFAGLNMTRDEFKKAAKDGELSAKLIKDAIASQTDAINTDFKVMAKTVEQSMTQIGNASLKLTGQIDNSLGITSKLGTVLTGISKDIESIEIDSDSIQVFENLAKSILVVGTAYLTTKKSIGIYSAITKISSDRNDMVAKSEKAKAKAHLLARRSIEKQNKAILGANTLKQTQINKLNKESIALNNASKKQALYATSLNKTIKSTNFATMATRGLSTALKTIAPFAIASGILAIADSLFTASSNAETLTETLLATNEELEKLTKNQLVYRKSLLDQEILTQTRKTYAAMTDAMSQTFFESDKEHKKDLANKDTQIEKLDELKKKLVDLNKVIANVSEVDFNKKNPINGPEENPNRGKKDNIEEPTGVDLTSTSLSAWEDYYIKIGDYKTAWLFKEAELNAQYKDLTTEQLIQVVEIYKTEFFDKINELEIDPIELNLELKGWSETSNAIASMGNSFTDLKNANEDYNKKSAKLDKDNAKDKKKLAKLQSNYTKDQLGGYGDIAGAAADVFGEQTAIAKVLSATEKGFHATKMAMMGAEIVMDNTKTAQKVSNDAIQNTSEATKSPLLFTNAVMAQGSIPIIGFGLAIAMAALLASFGGGGGGGGGGASALDIQKESFEKNADFEIDQLNRTNELLESIDNKSGSVSAGNVGIAQSNFNKDIGLLSFEVAKIASIQEKTQLENRQIVAEIITNLETALNKGLSEAERKDIGQINNGTMTQATVNEDGTVSFDFMQGITKAYLSFASLAEDISGTLTTVSFLNDLKEEDPDKFKKFFPTADLRKWVDEAQTAVNDYAISMIDVVGEMSSASDTFKDVYDEISQTNKFQGEELRKAFSDFDALRKENSYEDYLLSQIEAIKSVSDEIGTDLVDLLIDTDIDKIQEQIEAVNKLSEITGIAFENGVKEAINFVDSIELVGEALVTSTANIKSIMDGFRTDDTLAQNQASSLGVELAETAEEFFSQFEQMSNDLLGLTDQELSYLEASKDLIESRNTELLESQQDSIQSQIDGYNEYAATINADISTITSVIGSLSTVIEKLRGASDTSSQSLAKFKKSMEETQVLSTGDDLAAYKKSLSETIGFSSALTNVDNFTNSQDMLHAQASAANEFEDLNTTAESQLDLLSQIVINTENTVLALTSKLEEIGANISNSNSSLTDYFNNNIEPTNGGATTSSGIDSTDRVQSAFSSVFGNKADEDSSGFQYWVNQLDSNQSITDANLKESIARGVSSDGQGLDSAIAYMTQNGILEGKSTLDRLYGNGQISDDRANEIYDQYGLKDKYFPTLHSPLDYGTFQNMTKDGYTPFAQGGVVTAPTLGLIGENGYNEAVIPLKNPDDPLGIGKIVSELLQQGINNSNFLNDIADNTKKSDFVGGN